MYSKVEVLRGKHIQNTDLKLELQTNTVDKSICVVSDANTLSVKQILQIWSANLENQSV